jgi:tetratricopeptide (TPR) repeat protein
MWRAKRAPVCSNFRRRGPPKIVNIPALVLVLFLALPVSAQQGSIASPDASPLPSAPSQAADSVFVGTRKLVQQGKSSEAIAELQRLGAENPKLRGLAHELGTTYYKAGDYLKANDYPRARVAFARMFDGPRDSAAAYLFTARVLLRQEFDPIAEEYAKKAIELDPKLPLAHFFLGELHLYKSRIPEAVADFQAELGLNPGHAGTYYKLADAYSRIQKFDDAERLLQRSIWLDATSTGPYILLGKVLEKKGEPELAMRALQHALSMDPNNTVAHHLLGQAYQDMGRTADAERERKLAQQLQDAPGKPD